jgi:hypothetical protein
MEKFTVKSGRRSVVRFVFHLKRDSEVYIYVYLCMYIFYIQYTYVLLLV